MERAVARAARILPMTSEARTRCSYTPPPVASAAFIHHHLIDRMSSSIPPPPTAQPPQLPPFEPFRFKSVEPIRLTSALERRSAAVCAKVFLPSGIDVRGPAERRKAKPEPAHREAGGSKCSNGDPMVGHDLIRVPRSACRGRRYSSPTCSPFTRSRSC